jgi:uncharacterized protein YcfJ
MKSLNKKLLGATVAVITVVVVSAAAASYVTRQSMTPATAPIAQNTVIQHHVKPVHPQQLASAQPQQSRCNDSNILGYVAGGAVGGIAGHQLGKGAGNTAATIGGTLGGAYLGGQYIPLKNVTCRQ